MRTSARLDLGSLVRNIPFLVTALVATIGWFTAFIGQIIVEKKFDQLSAKGSGVGVSWFGIFLQLAVQAWLIYSLATASLEPYRFQLSVFLAVSLVFAILSVNQGIYGNTSSALAYGAGWLLISLVDIVWLLWLTADEDTFLSTIFGDLGAGSGGSQLMRGSSKRSHRSGTSGYGQHPNSSTAQLTPNTAYGGGYPAGGMMSAGVGNTMTGRDMPPASIRSSASAAGSMMIGASPSVTGVNSASPVGEKPSKARALYSYTASPTDPNELSFQKNEVLDVLDSTGKWWQARKTDGSNQTGIVPSNYMAMI